MISGIEGLPKGVPMKNIEGEWHIPVKLTFQIMKNPINGPNRIEGVILFPA